MPYQTGMRFSVRKSKENMVYSGITNEDLECSSTTSCDEFSLYNGHRILHSASLFMHWTSCIATSIHSTKVLSIHMCYNFLACESKMASILVGSSVVCPLNCPLYPYLKVVGCPLSCTLSCPLYPYMEVVGSLICMAKFPWVAHSTAHWAAHFFTFGSGWLPTEPPTDSIYGSSGQPNCIAKFPWAAHSAAHWAAHCFHIWK